MCLLVVYGCLWKNCTVHGIESLAEATGDQKEAEAESLPQLPCHFLPMYGVVCQWPVATRGNPWQPMATHGPRQGLHLADPKSGLEALGECQDSVRISDIAIGWHWQLWYMMKFCSDPWLRSSVAGFCGSKSYGDHWAGWWGRAWSCWIKYTSGLKPRL